MAPLKRKKKGVGSTGGGKWATKESFQGVLSQEGKIRHGALSILGGEGAQKKKNNWLWAHERKDKRRFHPPFPVERYRITLGTNTKKKSWGCTKVCGQVVSGPAKGNTGTKGGAGGWGEHPTKKKKSSQE